jgi:hypothetical protein
MIEDPDGGISMPHHCQWLIGSHRKDKTCWRECTKKDGNRYLCDYHFEELMYIRTHMND